MSDESTLGYRRRVAEASIDSARAYLTERDEWVHRTARTLFECQMRQAIENGEFIHDDPRRVASAVAAILERVREFDKALHGQGKGVR